MSESDYDVIITEIMANPEASFDTGGEWFEVYNNSGFDINLLGVTLQDDGGQFFDSSYQYGRPATFPTGRLIPGWVEGLQLMRPGDRWMMFIPSDLAYGKAGAPPAIPPNADLIFEVELEKVHAYD